MEEETKVIETFGSITEFTIVYNFENWQEQIDSILFKYIDDPYLSSKERYEILNLYWE